MSDLEMDLRKWLGNKHTCAPFQKPPIPCLACRIYAWLADRSDTDE